MSTRNVGISENQAGIGGYLKTMGYLKPWAPAFSYGLVVRFDEDLKPIASYHSRTSGNFHGTTSVIVDKGQNILVTSKGDGKLGGWK